MFLHILRQLIIMKQKNICRKFYYVDCIFISQSKKFIPPILLTAKLLTSGK